MVRTRADCMPIRISGGKAPVKSGKTTTPKREPRGSKDKGKNYSGGNPYHPRDTPEWQKPITCFINTKPAKESQEQNDAPGTSKETASNE